MTYTPGLWLFILASCIIGGLMLYSLRYWKTSAGRDFTLLMVCAFVWVFGFVFETALIPLSSKMVFFKIQFLGIALLPAIWVFLIFDFCGQKLSHKAKILFLIMPLLTNIIIWSNPLHHWFMGNPVLTTESAPFPVVFADYQFWFYFIHVPTGYVYLLIALGMLLRSFTRLDKIYRPQALLLLVSILLPALTDVLYVLGYSPIQYYNFTTAVFSISGLILIWALFSFRFLDLLPLARDMVIDNLDDSVIVFDHLQRMTYCNLAARQNFALSERNFGEALAHSQNEYIQQVARLLDEEKYKTDIEFGEKSKQYFDVRISPVRNRRELQIGWVVTAREITERMELFKRVENLSIRDTLTGIINRRHFEELARRELQRARRLPQFDLSLVMIDLDHFKVINDTHGHAAGDQVLLSFCQLIQSQLRPWDIFGRIGGEEFALLLLEVDCHNTAIVVERLRQKVEALNVSFGQHNLQITASFGVICREGLAVSELKLESLFELADQALYRAKQNGRNRVEFFHS